jgi:hypothetical protein
MLQHTLRRWGPYVVLVAAMAGFAAPAGAKTATYPVSGKQIVVDEDAGTYKMTGGLVGDWSVTSFTELATAPLYWAQFNGDALVWGACWHPVTGGTGAFKGASGDRPTRHR